MKSSLSTPLLPTECRVTGRHFLLLAAAQRALQDRRSECKEVSVQKARCTCSWPGRNNFGPLNEYYDYSDYRVGRASAAQATHQCNGQGTRIMVQARLTLWFSGSLIQMGTFPAGSLSRNMELHMALRGAWKSCKSSQSGFAMASQAKLGETPHR